MYFSLVVIVLTKALITEVCEALNVTVTPGPVVMVTESNNLTLSCLVSQRKRPASVLIVRWFYAPPPTSTLAFSPPPPPPPPSLPPPSPHPPPPSELLIVKLGIRKAKMYGNYSRAFAQPKFRLYEEQEGEAYSLLVLNVTGQDQGRYTCRVQEIRRHKTTWRASSNGTGTTQLTVHFAHMDGSGVEVWRLFADVYLCAVLICSLGLLSIFLFTLVLTCQSLHNRLRLKNSYLLVKCPESSSGETVTSSVSSSGSTPKAHRKEARQIPVRHLTPIPIPIPRAPRLPTPPEEPPPYIPTKAPAPGQRPRKPRRLKTQPRRAVQPRVSQDDNLTYAELELVRPRPLETPAAASSSCLPSSSSTTTISTSSSPLPVSPKLDPKASSSDTVYAQILFQERQL